MKIFGDSFSFMRLLENDLLLKKLSYWSIRLDNLFQRSIGHQNMLGTGGVRPYLIRIESNSQTFLSDGPIIVVGQVRRCAFLNPIVVQHGVSAFRLRLLLERLNAIRRDGLQVFRARQEKIGE